MHYWLFIPALLQLTWAEQLLWVSAVVFTILLSILLIMEFFSGGPDHASHRPKLLSASVILTFFTFWAWTSLLAHVWEPGLVISLLDGLPFGILAALFPFIILRLRKPVKKIVPSSDNFNYQEALSSTGEVLQYIPPHQEGFGRVHLNLRKAPYALDAISIGAEIRPGDSVRVVDIVDDHILVVEPLQHVGPQAPF
ncbi:MAG TPA: NfeD family protein [Haliscomenobacter sp.]|uniref:NfeD family protein n=1 Tax=Haliscomenobacter sp. TaxID=2717303 RepID=UPI002CCA014A|nr:NfeD family protein [Haliscomenobacter sp.]HOY16807.1 NfeD family protein [Haliscomenobacter sp.]HPH20083.1 NfeD family protein [Haliscomenobacter sp.]